MSEANDKDNKDDKLATEKVKGKSGDIELRSEKVRNIIGQIPPFLVRSGIGVIALVVVLALAVCYFIPYYETAEGHITLFSIPESEIYVSPVRGTVCLLPSFGQDGVPVNEGDTIGFIRPITLLLPDTPALPEQTEPDDRSVGRAVSLSAGSVIHLTANVSGRLSLNIRHGEKVNTGEILFAITPDSIASIYGQVRLPYGYREKIREGQQVKIEPAGFPSREYGALQGTVGKIYPLAVGKENRLDFSGGCGGIDSETADQMAEKMFLKADIALPEGLMTSYRKELQFTPDMQGKANIIISKQSLLVKLFKR